ncbi:MAG TPA: RNA polymerase sigma factor [Bacteroidales bacterium]|nr:RNA polymerase sigma factor [Bacteroidales bacterium]
MEPIPDQILLLKIKENPENFGLVFDAHYKTIFSYIYRRVADYDLARDLSADTFMKAFLHISHFNWQGISLLSWLYRIATNETNYYFRKNRTNNLLRDLTFGDAYLLTLTEESITEKQLLEEELKLNQDFLKAQQSIKKLDIKYQEVLSLRYFEKKSVLEIAEILNKKEGTIKSLLSRGLEKLKIEFFSAT